MYIEIEYFQLDLKFFPVVPRNLRSKKRLILQSDEIYQKYIYIYMFYTYAQKNFFKLLFTSIFSRNLYSQFA